MRSKISRESVDAALSKLDQKKRSLKESRLRLLNEIKRIDISLREIQTEYGKIVNEISPLLSLPTEVTCMIFDLFVASDSVDNFVGIHKLEAPRMGKKPFLSEVIVSHVCKQWRNISLSYPQLWTRFCFRSNYFGSMGNPLNRFDTYMERSGSQNLELFLDFRIKCTEIEPYYLMGRALKEIKRWRTVTLHLAEQVHIQDPLPTLLNASAPNLEYFAYSLRPPDDDSPMTHSEINGSDPTIFQGGAPKLRYLMLDGSSQTRLPSLSAITTLRIEGDDTTTRAVYSWEEFLEVLSIPSLANLSMIEIVSTVLESRDVRVVTMKNLKHLRYGLHEFMTLLLPFIRAPLLETLSIRLDTGPSERRIFGTNQPFIPEESYFFPSLQTLILIDSSPSSYPESDSIWRVMQMTKTISNFLIYHDIGEEQFFDGLRRYGRFDDECWPKLTSFTANTDHDSFETINEFLLSRPKDTVTLRLFRATHVDLVTELPDEYKKIQENCMIKVLTAKEEAETPFMDPSWPPGVDCPDYSFKDDPFDVETW